MRFTELGFEGFKSLKRVACKLDQVTVVTGPNGAGKSNLVEAFTLLSECFQFGLEFAVARAGGYENIAFRGVDKPPIPVGCAISAEFDISEISRSPRIYRGPTHYRRREPLTIHMSYRFAIDHPPEADDPSDFQIVEEFLEFRDDRRSLFKVVREGGSAPRFRRASEIRDRKHVLGEAFYPLSDDVVIQYAKSRVDDTTLLVSVMDFGGSVVDLITRHLGQARFFQLTPQQCRQPGVSTPNARLDRYGENLPSVAEHLRKNNPESWSLIEGAMRTVLPQLESVGVEFTQDRRLALVFREHGLSRPWNANEVSDGTVQALALFVALFDQRSPILAVEEPENALHPWILRHFLDLCRTQAKKLILLTTHSPVVIDYTPPENLRIMWNRNGESQLSDVSTLNPDVIEMWKSGEVRSFDIYDSGLVREYLPEEYVTETVES